MILHIRNIMARRSCGRHAHVGNNRTFGPIKRKVIFQK
ncbi:hypothetical protein SXCC_02842 [Gluconacetobacter sp. SXCC-1]|nr:hypothetical protein SXCC_02842 [Gluconacetobacter sp. SXCC-1]